MELYDKETGFYYSSARYYDPTVGRFLNEDPARAGDNWYVYCRSNPLSFMDISELEQIVVSGGDYSDDSKKKGFEYNFNKPAIKKIIQLRNENSNENIWILFKD